MLIWDIHCFHFVTLYRSEHVIGVQQVVLLKKIPHGVVDIQCMYTLCKLQLSSIGSQGFNFIFLLLRVFVYIHKIPCKFLVILGSHLFMWGWLDLVLFLCATSKVFGKIRLS